MELHRTADKFDEEATILLDLIDGIEEGSPSIERVELALAEAKRVRRESTVLVRQLAELRDQLQP